MQDRSAHQNNGVAGNDEDWEPYRKFSVIRIALAPISDAQRNDAAQEQTFVGDRVENGTECAALFVATRNISVEAVARGGEQENDNSGEPLPFQRRPALDALTIIDCQRHKHRNHQNPDNGDLVRGSHSGEE